MREAETGTAGTCRKCCGTDSHGDNGVRASPSESVRYGANDTGHNQSPRLSVVIGKPSIERRSQLQLPVFARMPHDSLHSSQLYVTVGGASGRGNELSQTLVISGPDVERKEKTDAILALVAREGVMKRIEERLALANRGSTLLEREGGLKGLRRRWHRRTLCPLRNLRGSGRDRPELDGTHQIQRYVRGCHNVHCETY
jgi:hypothetical protein